MLRSPYPYPGGKSSVALDIWGRLGNPPYFVEPFFGSGAVLLARPHQGCAECVNDADGMITNFWRAIAAEPEEVAEWADWPINELDLVARHNWLRSQKPELVERLAEDAGYLDAKVAGWWVWGICQWIGSGWCRVGQGGKRPLLSSGRGVHAERGTLSHGRGGVTTERKGVNRRNRHGHKLPPGDLVHCNTTSPKGACASRQADGDHRAYLTEWFRQLGQRLAGVRILCGDFERTLSMGSTVNRWSMTGVFLDPPYDMSRRARHLYTCDDASAAERAQAWCLEHGDNPKLRIALCGLPDEHAVLEQEGWSRYEWQRTKAMGGKAAESIWFSPHCLLASGQMTLFGEEEG